MAVTLTNVGTAYDATVASRTLPIGYLDFTGVSQILFAVSVNKVGTGTQSWQLWNETDGTQIALIDDAGSAGTKILETTQNVALSGVKLCRVRVKSTNNADDPVFYDVDVFRVTL